MFCVSIYVGVVIILLFLLITILSIGYGICFAFIFFSIFAVSILVSMVKRSGKSKIFGSIVGVIYIKLSGFSV